MHQLLEQFNYKILVRGKLKANVHFCSFILVFNHSVLSNYLLFALSLSLSKLRKIFFFFFLGVLICYFIKALL